MSTFTWSSTATGAWSNPVFWTVGGAATTQTPGGVNGNTDSALITAGQPSIAAPTYPDIVNLTITGASTELVVQNGLAVETAVTNAGTILVATNAAMTAGNLGEPSFGAFANTGLIDVAAGATFSMFAPMTTANLGHFAADTGRVVIAGLLDNSATLLAASSFTNLDLSGNIKGGTIRNDSASLHIVNRVPSGDGYPPNVVFNGVAFQGVLAPLGPLSITGGFSLAPLSGTRDTIDLTGTAPVAGLPPLQAAITALDNETFDNVSILLGALQAVTTITLGAAATVTNTGTGFLGGQGGYASSATISNTGFLAINNAGTFTNNNLIINAGGTITDDNGGTLLNLATIALSGGQLTAPVTGGGLLLLAGGATAELTASYGAQRFQFSGTDLLRLDTPGGTSQVFGFAPGDTIEAIGTYYPSTSFSNGTLTIANGNLTVASLVLNNSGSAQIHASTRAKAGVYITDITASAPCFAEGTRIATPAGPRLVETFRRGDEILLANGDIARVIWTGHRRLQPRRHPRPWDIDPVRIAPNAFAENQPRECLSLSPDHAVFVDGVLVPIRLLLNGGSIAQHPVASITYHHIELERHAVLLAEGLPCESYLDTGNRTALGPGPVMALHPDFARCIWDTQACAELLLKGPRLADIRRRLLARAPPLTDDPALRVLVDGQVLRPTINGRTLHLRIPPSARRLRLKSRVWTPALARADEHDTRRLGVAIAGLRFDGKWVRLGDSRLTSGWHDAEQKLRWTDGDAGIALSGLRDMTFDIAMTGSYALAPTASRRAEG